jgi:hypothetical protein
MRSKNPKSKRLHTGHRAERSDSATLVKGQKLAKGLRQTRLQHTAGDTLADDIALDGFVLARGLRELLR